MRKITTSIFCIIPLRVLASIPVIEHKGVRQANKLMRMLDNSQRHLVESINNEIINDLKQLA